MNNPAFNKAVHAPHVQARLSHGDQRLLYEDTEHAADGVFFRGLIIAIALSVPIWGVIIAALWSVL